MSNPDEPTVDVDTLTLYLEQRQHLQAKIQHEFDVWSASSDGSENIANADFKRIWFAAYLAGMRANN